MNDVLMLQPLVAWLLLVVLVSMRLGALRMRDFTVRRLRLQSYALREGRAPLTDAAERASDHYQNQFEMPVMFITACLLVHLAGLTDTPYVVSAWLYVALRVVHTAIHLTYNRVHHRFLVFLASFTPLAFIVGRLAWQMLFQG